MLKGKSGTNKNTETNSANGNENENGPFGPSYMTEEDYANFFDLGKSFGKKFRKDKAYKFSHFGADVYSEVSSLLEFKN